MTPCLKYGHETTPKPSNFPTPFKSRWRFPRLFDAHSMKPAENRRRSPISCLTPLTQSNHHITPCRTTLCFPDRIADWDNSHNTTFTKLTRQEFAQRIPKTYSHPPCLTNNYFIPPSHQHTSQTNITQWTPDRMQSIPYTQSPSILITETPIASTSPETTTVNTQQT